MNDHDSARHLRDLFDRIWNQHDLTAIREWQCVDPSPDRRHADHSLDGAAFVAHVSQLLDWFPDLHLEIHDLIVGLDRLVVRYTVTGTFAGGVTPLGVAPVGRRVSVGGICLCHLQDGQMVRCWFNPDRLGLYQQLGLYQHLGCAQQLTLSQLLGLNLAPEHAAYAPASGAPAVAASAAPAAAAMAAATPAAAAHARQMRADFRHLMLRIWNGKDLTAIDELYHADARLYHADGGHDTGTAGFASFVTRRLAHFPGLRVDVQEIVCLDDVLVSRAVWVGAYAGGIAGVSDAAIGRTARVQTVCLYRMVEGRIALGWASEDLFGMYEQLGALAQGPASARLARSGRGATGQPVTSR